MGCRDLGIGVVGAEVAEAHVIGVDDDHVGRLLGPGRRDRGDHQYTKNKVHGLSFGMGQTHREDDDGSDRLGTRTLLGHGNTFLRRGARSHASRGF